MELLNRTLPLMRHLCGQNLPERARVLAAFPQPFQEMVIANPAYEKPLHDLWETYIRNFDLVRAFRIADPSGARGLLTWARGNASTGTLYEPQMLKQHETFFRDLRVDLSDRILTERPDGVSETSPVQCDVGLNSVPNPQIHSAISNTLTVEGWTAISAKNGTVADEVFLTLSNAKQKLWVETRTEPRPDVNSHFGHPEMPDSGFTADIDVSKLNGEYALGLARIYKGKLDSCQNLNIPLRFSR